MRATLLSLTLLALGSAFLAGCGESITGTTVLDAPPETEVTATPPVLSETGYTVSFFWTGADPDGSIEGYQWKVSDNGLDNIVDVQDTISSRVPWRFTTATDSTFIVTADIPDFPKDLADSLGENSVRFWQTHTFFIRSVDRTGNVDPTPAHVSFTATTLAPTVAIQLPATQPLDCSLAPPALTFEWDANDPDNQERNPAAVRYLLKKIGNKDDDCLLKGQYETADPAMIRADDPNWGPWIRWEAELDSAKIVRYPVLPPSDVGTTYLFAVQARDVAGAVTPTFDWDRNVRHVRVTDTKSPALTVTERFLGTDLFVGRRLAKQFTIASQQVIEFSWFADATSYGNLIEGYRYGFNLLDANDPDDKGWVVPWGTGDAWRRAAPRVFTQGSPNFIVQARDSSNQLSRATYLLQVVQVARRSEQRRLLLVDDHPKTNLSDTSVRYDRAWDEHWSQLIRDINVEGFQQTDVIDAIDEFFRLSFPTVNDYRGVIWFIGPGEDSFFNSSMAPQNTQTPQFNWLEVYQSFVGNVFFVGSSAMKATLEFYRGEYPIVFNAKGTGTLGTVRGTDGEEVYAGTLRYPYTGWCLDALDFVRPGVGNISGEPDGSRLRETKCSAIVYAGPTTEFYAEFDATPTDVPALLPTDIRKFGKMKYNANGLDPAELNILRLQDEEFYNANVTSRPVAISPRSCQTPMFRAIARRDVDEPSIFESQLAAGWTDEEIGLGIGPAIVDSIYSTIAEEWWDNCASQISRDRRATSPISLKTIAVASDVFSGRGSRPGTKQFGTLKTADFLWGFNPVHFQQIGVRSALDWIVIRHWGVNGQ